MTCDHNYDVMTSDHDVTSCDHNCDIMTSDMMWHHLSDHNCDVMTSEMMSHDCDHWCQMTSLQCSQLWCHDIWNDGTSLWSLMSDDIWMMSHHVITDGIWHQTSLMSVITSDGHMTSDISDDNWSHQMSCDIWHQWCHDMPASRQFDISDVRKVLKQACLADIKSELTLWCQNEFSLIFETSKMVNFEISFDTCVKIFHVLWKTLVFKKLKNALSKQGGKFYPL